MPEHDKKVIYAVCRVDGKDVNAFVKSYDPTIHEPNGSYNGGRLEFTKDPREAFVYADFVAASEAWRQTSGCRCHGIRKDGKPNRPLTAYTITIMSVEDALKGVL